MYSEYNKELEKLRNASEILKADTNYMAVLLADAITSFTNLDYLVDLVLRSHLDLALNKELNQEIEEILNKKFVDFSEKIPVLEKIANYAGINKFHSGRFIKCAGDRNKIVHGFYRILDDDHGVPTIFVINKNIDGDNTVSRPQKLCDELEHSINLCTVGIDEIFVRMGLPKYGELSNA